MHLSYLYTTSFDVLQNIGFSFDHRYSFSISDGNTLIIRRNDTIPADFWEQGIYSLTAIIGVNGSGKTTVLRLLKHLFVEGYPRNEDLKVLIVYEQNGELYIYNTTNIKVVAGEGIVLHPESRRFSLETFYYSGHFQPYMGVDGEMELAGSYEASDAWLLVKDLQDYSNIDSLHLSEPLYNYLLAYFAQNNYRICEILALDGLSELLKTIQLPKFVQFAPNTGGWNAIKLGRISRFDKIEIPREQLTSVDIKEKSIERIVYYDIINLIAEGKGNQSDLLMLLNDWVKAPKNYGIVNALTNYVKERKMAAETYKALGSLLYVVKKMVAICDFDEGSGSFYLDVQKDKDRLRSLLEEVINSQYFLTARFFDFIYSHNLYENTFLSSGELELLNLLSRLNYGISIAPKRFGNIESPRLLLIDEAEIGYHPKLQMQYVRILNEFIHYMRVKGGVDFQIVITSHSPIILSDVPACCVNFLNRENGKSAVIVSDEKETFGENVFNLYRRAFFMKNGLIGAFAQKKLNQVVKDIEEDEVTVNTRKTIALTGDLRIRDYLLRRIASKNIDSEIAYHEAMIQELKARRRTKNE